MSKIIENVQLLNLGILDQDLDKGFLEFPIFVIRLGIENAEMEKSTNL